MENGGKTGNRAKMGKSDDTKQFCIWESDGEQSRLVSSAFRKNLESEDKRNKLSRARKAIEMRSDSKGVRIDINYFFFIFIFCNSKFDLLLFCIKNLSINACA